MTQIIYLNENSLEDASNRGINVPQYRKPPSTTKIGIVHIGPGAFFRAHQAWYTHQALKHKGGHWCISAVSLRSRGVSEALTDQDGLYCLAELDKETHFEVVGAIKEVLVAREQYAQVIARLTNIDTKFVTMTITEKGYCLNSQGELDLTHQDIKHDLQRVTERVSAVGILVEALSIRHEKGLPAFTVISCDNITGNGTKLKKSIVAFASQTNKKLSDWLAKGLTCPSTMVDSITPATDDALRDLISQKLDIKDNWPIKREAFLQWVIEDCLPSDRPAWEEVGAVLTQDVEGFEKAKLRLLNCTHSSLAYLGSLMGIETVYDAMQNTQLITFIEKMIDEEILPSIDGPKELDAKQYSQDILQRYRNPAIRHLLSQIAWDGSQKIPMRILPIIQQNLEEGRSVRLLCHALAAWMHFVRLRLAKDERLVDPLASQLEKLGKSCSGNAQSDVSLFLSISSIFPASLVANSELNSALVTAYKNLAPVLNNNQHSWFV
ncbi:MAG: mannitol dehydrogenase family protein [Paraglaciecola sp.]|uniref:mannitol dehydrogenase family protein n=1 Tax=Paraglaciecola sp. TaxID=1920173 RepID=UPI0032992640